MFGGGRTTEKVLLLARAILSGLKNRYPANADKFFSQFPGGYNGIFSAIILYLMQADIKQRCSHLDNYSIGSI